MMWFWFEKDKDTSEERANRLSLNGATTGLFIKVLEESDDNPKAAASCEEGETQGAERDCLRAVRPLFIERLSLAELLLFLESASCCRSLVASSTTEVVKILGLLTRGDLAGEEGEEAKEAGGGEEAKGAGGGEEEGAGGGADSVGN
jgi:hypothetical protein